MTHSDFLVMSGRGGLPDEELTPERRASPDFPFGRRVLIAEDNWLIGIEWQAALEAAGYEVLGPAVSAEETIAMGDEERPDFALMDIRLLGHADGVDAAIELQSRLKIPSIFVSAHDDPDTRERGLAAHPLGWITKPVVASRLPDMIRQMKTTKS